ncbi:MAG: hypothetical protein JNL38_08335 [Myxococcales bacterium]|jgi:hypothetical protein|nr:hypothetical protein [Myxococcales bacterium]
MATKKASSWKRGRGKLGVLEPLLGAWQAEVASSRGAVRCIRTFSRVLSGAWIQLDARWELPGKAYEERALYGVDAGGELVFHSFTSDGKRSEGRRADAADVHPEAVAFVAEMPAGTARMVYWPGDDGALCWAVESKTKKGWKRFTHHVYRPVAARRRA